MQVVRGPQMDEIRFSWDWKRNGKSRWEVPIGVSFFHSGSGIKLESNPNPYQIQTKERGTSSYFKPIASCMIPSPCTTNKLERSVSRIQWTLQDRLDCWGLKDVRVFVSDPRQLVLIVGTKWNFPSFVGGSATKNQVGWFFFCLQIQHPNLINTSCFSFCVPTYIEEDWNQTFIKFFLFHCSHSWKVRVHKNYAGYWLWFVLFALIFDSFYNFLLKCWLTFFLHVA